MKSKKEFIVPFIGLKLGLHDFEFEIHDTFFEEREYSTVQKGTVKVTLQLEKKETMMIGAFSIQGLVISTCDRCNDQLEVPVEGNFRLIYRFGTDLTDDETLVVLHPDDYEIDLRESIYEFIIISLPVRLIHPKNECNQEMVELINKYTIQPEESEQDWQDQEDVDDDDWEEEEEENGDDDFDITDPRWSALKKLN